MSKIVDSIASGDVWEQINRKTEDIQKNIDLLEPIEPDITNLIDYLKQEKIDTVESSKIVETVAQKLKKLNKFYTDTYLPQIKKSSTHLMFTYFGHFISIPNDDSKIIEDNVIFSQWS